MALTPISALAAQTVGTSSTTSRTSDLTSSAFLSLLTAQMQNQDPLEPMTGDQMLNQIAQMTSVSELMKLNDNFTSMAKQGTSITDVAALLGRQVEWKDATTGATDAGKVTKVQQGDSGWEVQVGSTTVSLSNLLAVE